MSRMKISATFKGSRHNSIESLERAIKEDIRNKTLVIGFRATQALMTRIWEDTPVVTGNTKSNWQVVSPGEKATWDKDVTGHRPPLFANSAPGLSFSITNAAPALYGIELRSGFMRTALMDWREIVAGATEGLKK